MKADAVCRVVYREKNVKFSSGNLAGRRSANSEFLLRAMVMDKDQPIAVRFGRHEDRPVDLQLWKGSHGMIW
jgi:hypothetical protein